MTVEASAPRKTGRWRWSSPTTQHLSDTTLLRRQTVDIVFSSVTGIQVPQKRSVKTSTASGACTRWSAPRRSSSPSPWSERTMTYYPIQRLVSATNGGGQGGREKGPPVPATGLSSPPRGCMTGEGRQAVNRKKRPPAGTFGVIQELPARVSCYNDAVIFLFIRGCYDVYRRKRCKVFPPSEIIPPPFFHLQTNKVKQVVGRVDLIESVGSSTCWRPSKARPPSWAWFRTSCWRSTSAGRRAKAACPGGRGPWPGLASALPHVRLRG